MNSVCVYVCACVYACWCFCVLQTLLGLEKEWDSPNEVGGRRKGQHVLGDVGMRYSQAVMFHVFAVIKRRENTAVMSKDH